MTELDFMFILPLVVIIVCFYMIFGGYKTCNGKIVTIDGKQYKLQEVNE